jgi:hypothetical protein
MFSYLVRFGCGHPSIINILAIEGVWVLAITLVTGRAHNHGAADRERLGAGEREHQYHPVWRTAWQASRRASTVVRCRPWVTPPDASRTCVKAPRIDDLHLGGITLLPGPFQSASACARLAPLDWGLRLDLRPPSSPGLWVVLIVGCGAIVVDHLFTGLPGRFAPISHKN